MKGFYIGQGAKTSRLFSEEDVANYHSLTGDTALNFGGRTANDGKATIPGPLLGGLFSYLLGTQLPGRGTNWLKQSFSFPRSAYLDEEVTAEVSITRLRPHKAVVNLSTICKNPAGEIVCHGKALVLVSDLELAPDID